MPAVLERFSLLRAPFQGRDLYELFQAHPGLGDRQPGSEHRYGRDPWLSAYHVGRIGLAHNIQAFIIRNEARVASGVGTVVGPQTIETNGEQIFGYDIDYWTAVRDAQLEGKVAQELLNAAAKAESTYWNTIGTLIHDQAEQNRRNSNAKIYGTIDPSDTTNSALATVMTLHGTPAPVQVIGNDPMGVGSQENVQLYLAQTI